MEEIFLNLIPTGNHQVCHVSQYDVGRQIKVNLFEGSLAYELQEGDSLVLDIRKPDGVIISAELAVEVGSTFAYIITIEEMCDVMGENLCELRLKNGTKDIGSLNFTMQIEEAVGEVEPLPPPTPPTPPEPSEPSMVSSSISNANYIADIDYILEVTTL